MATTPEYEVGRLNLRLSRAIEGWIPLELGTQSPGDGSSIYTLTRSGHILLRGQGRKQFLIALFAFEGGIDLGIRIMETYRIVKPREACGGYCGDGEGR